MANKDIGNNIVLPSISKHISVNERSTNTHLLYYNYSLLVAFVNSDFVDDEGVDRTLKNSKILIDETNVEMRPEKLPDALRDENDDIH